VQLGQKARVAIATVTARIIGIEAALAQV